MTRLLRHKCLTLPLGRRGYVHCGGTKGGDDSTHVEAVGSGSNPTVVHGLGKAEMQIVSILSHNPTFLSSSMEPNVLEVEVSSHVSIVDTILYYTRTIVSSIFALSIYAAQNVDDRWSPR